VPQVFELQGYLERVGLQGRPSLKEIHRAHATSIPFENLDPHRGEPVSLALADLQRKLVQERRGGYCFEQNLLLKAAAEALGAQVETMLARVRLGAQPGTVRAPTHLVLRVEHEGAAWLADVGFGMGTLLEPVPFEPGGVHEQAGWQYQLVRDGEELVLRRADARGEWGDLYGFIPRAVPPIDIEMSNWFAGAHPASMFVKGLLIARYHADGKRVALSDWGELQIVEQTPFAASVTPLERAEVPDALARHFALGGFALDERGRVVRGS
jgi:N-hydroxyarylamine O-acetyltransferase